MTEHETYAGLLDPTEVARMGRLEVVATRVVEGYLAGMHRSPFKGSSVEFAEHRPYAPGDEMRMIDWRVYAKSDRYYVKEFEEETNLAAMLVVDASGSMGFGASTVTKLQYAKMTAAILARLLLNQQDGVGLAVIDKTLRSYVPPRAIARHFNPIIESLTRAEPAGETSLAEVLHELAQRTRRRGMMVLCSDCFDDLESLRGAFHHLRSRGHQLLLFHIMAPEELSFDFTQWTHFEDLESGERRVDLDPPTVRRHYLEQVGAFLRGLRGMCGEIGIEYMPITTDQPLGEALAGYLKRRVAMRKKRLAR